VSWQHVKSDDASQQWKELQALCRAAVLLVDAVWCWSMARGLVYDISYGEGRCARLPLIHHKTIFLYNELI
jgi:hypothetical protein